MLLLLDCANSIERAPYDDITLLIRVYYYTAKFIFF